MSDNKTEVIEDHSKDIEISLRVHKTGDNLRMELKSNVPSLLALEFMDVYLNSMKAQPDNPLNDATTTH